MTQTSGARVVVLGCTGIDKTNALAHLHGVKIIDFEKDYLRQVSRFRSWADYLFMDPLSQAETWAQALELLEKDSKTWNAKDNIILSLHGTLVRGIYGVSIGIDVYRLCHVFAPSLVITLLDDIYSLWWRTEKRADGLLDRGRPTLEELLMARRTEVMVGDQVAAEAGKGKGRVRHIALSVNHPVSTLSFLIHGNPQVVYLSFPISAPRELLASVNTGDKTVGVQLVSEINDFHRRAFAQQSGDVVFISPLAIDELPLVFKGKKSGDPISFLYSDRWDMAAWGQQLLSNPPLPMPIPLEQFERASGIIQTDVGWRDYRLVQQADCLAVYCPVPPRVRGVAPTIARGVLAEVGTAQSLHKRSVVLQKPEYDPKGVWNAYAGNPGSMGASSNHLFIHKVNSLESLLDAASRK